ncbi:hypothetical protein LZZ90_01760 [Flavobacterium sp. SM15]|uniref:hypothetical protein n=1 Tax=Flavobacterium sp. SM15 TaxID=2908005 RepID=UPI001EDC75BD|nr:hypothetical protein [Flavobacterium sp. SM15]MCG2610228.1 hypothetical protein [Flavobacterium sp. SM15]
MRILFLKNEVLYQKNIRKLLNIAAFYSTTLTVNVLLSLTGFLFGGFSESILMFVSFGFITSLAIKEVKSKEEYLFYFNNGLSRLALWGSSLLINFLVALILSCIYVFIFKSL